MNINQFIRKCQTHNWEYRQSTNDQVYYLGKKQERELYIAIQQNPDWFEIYAGYQAGILTRRA